MIINFNRPLLIKYCIFIIILPILFFCHSPFVKYSYYSVNCKGTLSKIGTKYGAKYGHDNYFAVYEKYFCGMWISQKPIRIVEFGIGGYTNEKTGGESLWMWSEFFGSHSSVIGIDVEKKSLSLPDNVVIFEASQTDTIFLKQVICEKQIDIVIDDASHRPSDIIKTFETLWPCLSDHGYYAIEDTQTSYFSNYGGAKDLTQKNTTMNYFKVLLDSQNYKEILTVDEEYKWHFSANMLLGIHFYHNLILIEKGWNEYPHSMGVK